MAKKNQHSIAAEPQLQEKAFEGDPGEGRAAKILAREPMLEQERVEQSVANEPALKGLLPAEKRDLYQHWLQKMCRQTSTRKRWLLALLMAAAAGPWAILGALLSSGQSLFALFAIVVFGPVAEELMKIGLPLYAVERRPYWIASRLQLLLTCAAGGLVFAIIENILYLEVYVPNPSTLLHTWRWTVCTGLHVCCSLIASLGLMRVWRQTMDSHSPPQLWLAAGPVTLAAIVHGLYNGAAVLMSLGRFNF